MAGGDDPTAVRSVAVTARDVVAAYEATHQTERDAVLRVTPPFSGRMRARLHVRDAGSGGEVPAAADTGPDGASPLVIPPGDLLADAPDYPHPDDTEDLLRSDPDVEYTRERHRERHEAALARWRDAAEGAIADAVVVETPVGPHEVEVTVLGE